MRRYRLSAEAKADIAAILRASEASHGAEARALYRALLTSTLRRIASDPEATPTQDRSALGTGLRSLHTRHGRDGSREGRVAAPVHVVYFRNVDGRTVAIVRILHERMDAQRRLSEISTSHRNR